MLNKCIYFVLFLKVFTVCASDSLMAKIARDRFMAEIGSTCQGPTFKQIVARQDFVAAVLISLDGEAVKKCPVLRDAILHATDFEKCMASASFAAVSNCSLSYDQKLDTIRGATGLCRRLVED